MAKKTAHALARPARKVVRKAPVAGKSAIGVKLQEIADDPTVRCACHVTAWRDRAGDGCGNSEGDKLYWGKGAIMTPQPISRRRRARLKVEVAQ